MRRISILARTWKADGLGRMMAKERLFKEVASKSGSALNLRMRRVLKPIALIPDRSPW